MIRIYHLKLRNKSGGGKYHPLPQKVNSRPGNNSSPTGRLRFWSKTYYQSGFVDFSKLMQYITYIWNLRANKNDYIQMQPVQWYSNQQRCQESKQLIISINWIARYLFWLAIKIHVIYFYMSMVSYWYNVVHTERAKLVVGEHLLSQPKIYIKVNISH